MFPFHGVYIIDQVTKYSLFVLEILRLPTMKKQKQQSKDIELGEDPKVLYKHYLAACDAIGIPYYPQLKRVLTNEDNPNRGSQIIIIRENPLNGKEADVFGSGNCRALMNAIIGKPNAMTITQSPYTAVKDIRIIHCSIKDGGAAAIASLLFATARPIVNPASDESATSPPDWKLEYLELINNDISSDGALVLGRSLSVGMNTTLSTLILDFNETLRSDGAAALCKGLSTNSTLKKLSLKYCNIDKGGGKPIAEMLSFKKLGLISLDLTCNQLGGIGLGDICQGLGKNSCLKTFRFADNHLHSTVDDLRAIQSFAGVLVNHPALIAVDLLHNKIGSKGGSLLLPVVQKNKQITTLKIDAEMDDELYAQLFKVSLPARKGGKKKTKKKKK